MPFRMVGTRDTVLLASGLSVVVEVDRERFVRESRRVLVRRNGGRAVVMVVDVADAIVWPSAIVSVVVFKRLLYRSFGTKRFRVVSETLDSVDDGSVVDFSG